LKQQRIGVHLVLNASQVGAAQLVWRIRHFKQNPLEMIKGRGHDRIAIGGYCLAVEAVVRQQLPRFSLERVIDIARPHTGVIQLHKQAFGTVKMVVEDKKNDALLCLG
jgi:hypothetical protein